MSSPRSCHHVLPTGRPCGSPALRGEQFCFYHHPTRRPPRRHQSSRTCFYLPPIGDAEDLQLALSEVIRRVADNTLDTKRAGLLLQTLQVAKSNLSASHRELMRAAESETEPDAPSPDFPDLSELLAILSPHPTPTAPRL